MAFDSNGLVIIDKAAGMSSAQAVARVKKILRAKKAGHAGTLDPFATGVLVCCLNRATRLARFLLRGFKKYDAVLRLGQTTDTQDATGRLTSESSWQGIDEQQIRSVCRQFVGTVEQKPPIYSALKHQGVPLYKLARDGKPVQKPARNVFIEALAVQDIALPEVRFTVSCSAGTYVRTLCADIGAQLKCGGHLKRLRRTYSSGFTIDEAVSLEKLAEQAATASAKTVPLGKALRGMPSHIADDDLADKIRRGAGLTPKDVALPATADSRGLVQVRTRSQDLLAVIQADRPGKRWKYCCVFN